MSDKTNFHNNDNPESNRGPSEKPRLLIPGIHMPPDRVIAQNIPESGFRGFGHKVDPDILAAIKEGDKMASLLLEGKFAAFKTEKDQLGQFTKRDVVSDEFKDKIADVWFNVMQMPDDDPRKQQALVAIGLRVHEAVKAGLINPQAEADINRRVGEKCQKFQQDQQNQANQDYQNQPAFNPSVSTDHPLSTAEANKLAGLLLRLGLLK